MGRYVPREIATRRRRPAERTRQRKRQKNLKNRPGSVDDEACDNAQEVDGAEVAMMEREERKEGGL